VRPAALSPKNVLDATCRWIHNDWQRMSPREIACVMYLYARYRRQPRRMVLMKSQFHLEKATARWMASHPDEPMFRPPPDDDRLRRTAFSALSGSGAPLDIPNASWALGVWRMACPHTTSRLAAEGMAVMDELPPEAIVRLVWGLAACKQRHGGIAAKAKQLLERRLAALSFPMASLLLWATAYHQVGWETLASLALGSPLVQEGHDRPAVLHRLPAGTLQQLVEARAMLVTLDPSANQSLPALPVEALAMTSPSTLAEQRRRSDPITRVYNSLANALAQHRVAFVRHFELQNSLVIPLAIPALRTAVVVDDTPLHQPSRAKGGKFSPDALARGDWVSSDAMEALESQKWRVAPISFRELTMCTPLERKSKLSHFAAELGIQQRAREATGTAGKSSVLPPVL
jgi:hypothetical protein